ncbi:MAG: hypothetical protein ACR2QC_09040, partial [Gammaproteobacteria bacterium]
MYPSAAIFYRPPPNFGQKNSPRCQNYFRNFRPPPNPVRRRISPYPEIPFHPTSHSGESRNLRRRIAAGNCTLVRLRRQFAPFGAEIPAFAGMGRGGTGMEFPLFHSRERGNLIRRKANPPFALPRKEIPAFAGMAALLRYSGTFN